MPDKPLIGGSRWDQDGIQPAKAFWTEVNAHQKAMLSRVFDLPDSKVRNDLIEHISKQGIALQGLLKALYELEVIGIGAKRDRLDNGQNS